MAPELRVDLGTLTGHPLPCYLEDADVGASRWDDTAGGRHGGRRQRLAVIAVMAVWVVALAVDAASWWQPGQPDLQRAAPTAWQLRMSRFAVSMQAAARIGRASDPGSVRRMCTAQQEAVRAGRRPLVSAAHGPPAKAQVRSAFAAFAQMERDCRAWLQALGDRTRWHTMLDDESAGFRGLTAVGQPQP